MNRDPAPAPLETWAARAAARWIARAKETLALRVRDRLLAHWRVSEASFPALRTLIDSQIDLSLERLLASD